MQTPTKARLAIEGFIGLVMVAGGLWFHYDTATASALLAIDEKLLRGIAPLTGLGLGWFLRSLYRAYRLNHPAQVDMNASK